ncbi:MAG: hypothetical protein E6G57_08970 [Actinobacteria bacterium]|nr:MAG: hypothetical protein E6G57_08970 [Actinomycetota bacterium]
MGKVVKGILIGGVIGAAVAGMKSLQSDQPSEEAGGEVAKTAMTGAAVGGGLALLLKRRQKKKQAKKRLKLGAALTAGGLAEAARAARPVIEQAAEVARERASRAAEAARPALESAADVARDRASRAAAAAQAKLEDVASNGDRPILVRLG